MLNIGDENWARVLKYVAENKAEAYLQLKTLQQNTQWLIVKPSKTLIR